MSFWHFLQSKHVLRERLLTGLVLQYCAQIPEKCHFLSKLEGCQIARSMKDVNIP